MSILRGGDQVAYQVTSEDWMIVASKIKELYIQMEVVSEDGKTLGIMEGDLLSGTLSIDADSSSRRSFNPVFYVRNKDYLPTPDSFVWFNRYVKVKLGIKVPLLSDYKWYSLGKFLFNENSYEYDAETKTVSVQLVDMMETLTGTLSGAIGGADQTTIPSTSTIRNAMISTVQQLGSVNKYIISKIGTYSADGDPADEQVPFDLEFSTGASVYDVISKLRDLYSGYETFFDVDGTFICQQTPTCIGDPDVLTSSDIDNYGLVVSEKLSVKFPDIKNVTEVWGKSLESDRYTDNSSLVDVLINMKITSRLTATFENCTTLEDGLIYGIKTPNVDVHGKNPVIRLLGDNNIVLYSGQIVTLDNKPIPKNTLQPNTEYCFQYKNNILYLLGQSQIHAITMLVSKEPSASKKAEYSAKYNSHVISYVVDPYTQFGVDQIGVRLQVLSGGDYDDIYSDDLARQRAEYENWKSTAFQDTIDVTMILIPWLEVNQKIRYKNKTTGEVGQYIVKKIDFSLTDGTMNLSLMRFHGLYPFSN